MGACHKARHLRPQLDFACHIDTRRPSYCPAPYCHNDHGRAQLYASQADRPGQAIVSPALAAYGGTDTSPLRTGLSTSPTCRSALNSPAQTLKMHTYPQAWTEAALRCKIEKARLAQIKGRDTHRMFKQ